MLKPKTIFTNENLLHAYLSCRINKRRTASALEFELECENKLGLLLERLQNKSYKPSESIYFVVTKPKPREIFAANFEDRIVHHLLINEIEKPLEKSIFLPNSCACRVGKGHHYATQFLHERSKNYQYFGQFDIGNFFSSINRQILFELVAKTIGRIEKPAWWKEEVVWLSQIIIFSDPTKSYQYRGDKALQKLVPQHKSLFNQKADTGLPIGNLSSQFFANVYLHTLDDYVTRVLGIEGYVRYVDDFVILSNDKKEIVAARNKIKIFLEENPCLTLHPKKQQIQPTRHGIPFVGYFIKPTHVTIRRNVVKNVKTKLYYFAKDANADEKLPQFIQALNSYYGHFRKAKSRRLREHLINEHLPERIREQLWVKGQYEVIKIVKNKKIVPPHSEVGQKKTKIKNSKTKPSPKGSGKA